MVITLTVKEALAQGYTFCGEQCNQPSCIEIESCEFDGQYFLYDKKPIAYGIAETEIKELLDDHLCGQDTVYDEDGELNDILETIDFSEITKTINEAFAKGPKFWPPTDIILTP